MGNGRDLVSKKDCLSKRECVVQAAGTIDRVVTAQGLRRSYGFEADRFDAVRDVDLERSIRWQPVR